MADFDLSMAITADGDQAVGELRQVKSANDQLTESTKAATSATQKKTQADKDAQKVSDATARTLRNQSTQTRMLGVQINDVATQLSLGQRPMQVFAAQAGQIGYAMAGMGGKFEKVGGFIAGPWGAAILLAVTGLGLLYNKLTDAEKATGDLTKAQDLQKLSLTQLADAIAAEAKELDKATMSGREAERQALATAQAKQEETKRRLENAKAALEELKASQQPGQVSQGGVVQIDASSAERGRIQGEIDLLDRLLARTEQSVRAAQIPISQRQSAARNDPRKGIDEEYQARVDNANKLYRQGTIGLEEYNRQLDNANAYQKQATDALKEHNRQQTGLPKVTDAEVISLLKSTFGAGTAITSTERSAAHNRAVGGAANSYHLTGGPGAIDFVPAGGMGNFDKAKLQEAGAAIGLKILEVFGPGDKEHGDHGHIAFSRTRLGPDQVAAQEAAAQRKAEAAQRAADQLASFGASAGNRIADLGARFSADPTRIVQIKQALADVDLIMAEIEKRKPPNFEALLAQGQAAKATIEDSINRPYKEFIDDQLVALENQRLIDTGHEDEAEALKIIADLEKQVGDLTGDQEAAIRAITAARKAERAEAQRAREEQRKYMDAIAATRDAFRGIFDLNGQGLKDLPRRLKEMAGNLVGDMLFEKIFGNIFRELQDQVEGTDTVKTASDAMAQAIDAANKSLDTLGQAAVDAANKLSGVDPLAPLPGGDEGGVPPEESGDIIVTAQRSPAIRDPAGFFGSLLEKLAKGILGKEMANKIGSIVGQALQGAAIGSMAANSILGERSKTGNMAASIGGAIGGFAGKALGSAIGGPVGGAIGQMLGSAVGGVLGGLVGGKKKLPSGGTSITNVYEQGNYSGAKSLSTDINQLSRSIQDGILDIANRLGGGLGNFNVSVGKYDGDWRVNTSGLTGSALRAGSPGTFDFNDDEQAAIMFAIADAIKDGAVTGLSDAVKRALASSDDIERGLREALKVQELEQALGGVGSQFEKAFRDFENVAKERVRLAKTYGLDLVKVEELNAKEREKVLKDVLDQRLGGLRQFLKDLDFGDLAEGTPADKRRRLLGEITTVRAQADRGEDGAADKLADLERQLVETTREAFGTAGPEYAADRAQAKADAERIIAEETKRAQEAQERAIASLNAAQQQVALQNETNDLLARMLARLDNMAGTIPNPTQVITRYSTYRTNNL